MTASTSEYAVELESPEVHPTTPRYVAAAIERAHERHLRDWIIEARRRAYEQFIVTRFGRVVNEVDTGLRTETGSSLWKHERYRIETTAADPDRPTVSYCAPDCPHLTTAEVEAVRPRVREDLLDVFEADVHEAINRTLRVYNDAVAAFATRQLIEFVDTYRDLTPGGDGEESAERIGVRSFDLGGDAGTVDVPTEASK